jgi:hexosaminidase
MYKHCLHALSLITLVGLSSAAAAASWVPAIVPWPKSVEVGQGMITLNAHSRIVSKTASLEPLAKVLAEEIHAVAGLDLQVATGQPGPGDIGLALDPALAKESYNLIVGEHVAVRGADYGAVALGTVTLLQSLNCRDGAVSIPRISVADGPAVAFRGLMIDVARKHHSIESLKQIVTLCRLYKVRYLQLHLTDDQSFMFPSKAYPLLATKNQHGGKTYTIEQLKDLVAYADARNVTIVPELEVPGHAATMNRAMHDLFIIRDTRPYEHHASINFVKDDVLHAVETIVGEMCEVFSSTPYFHIGGDEADLALAAQNVDFKAAMKKYNLPNQHELYRRFVGQMNEIVKKHGKQTIVWEGFGRQGVVPIPKDILVMSYEIRFYQPQDLVQDGYRVINASWTPLYVVNANCRPPAEIYAWNLRQFKPFGAKPTDQGIQVPAGDKVVGAMMCAWEQPEKLELPNERNRVPAMMERIWNPAAGKTYADFNRRFAATDRLLDLMVHKFSVQADGLTDHGGNAFTRSATLSLQLSPSVRGTIRYTLDGKDPTVTSAAYTKPLTITATTEFKAQVFDADGTPLGGPRWTRYELRPSP